MGTCQTQPSKNLHEHELSLQLTTKDQAQSRDLQKQDHLFQSLDFFLPFENDYASFKKLTPISRTPCFIKSTCDIPERNLLLALSKDSKTIYIYRTLRNFNLVAKKISQVQLDVITYSKELNKIIVSGEFLQILNPKNFQVEAQSQFPDHSYQLSLVYVPISQVIVVKTAINILVYDRNLSLLMKFPFPSYEEKTWSSTLEIFEISKDLLLGLYHEKNSKLFLLNLKRKSIQKYDRLNFRYGSCLQMTQEAPDKVFTCLAIRKSERLPHGKYPFKMVQFLIDPKTEEPVILKISKTSHCFNTVKRLGNTKYFLAENFDLYDETALLSLNDGHVQVTRMVSDTNFPFNELQNFALIILKGGSSMVYINSYGMCLYRFVVKPEDLNTSMDSEEFCAPVNQRKTGIKT